MTRSINYLCNVDSTNLHEAKATKHRRQGSLRKVGHLSRLQKIKVSISRQTSGPQTVNNIDLAQKIHIHDIIAQFFTYIVTLKCPFQCKPGLFTFSSVSNLYQITLIAAMTQHLGKFPSRFLSVGVKNRIRSQLFLTCWNFHFGHFCRTMAARSNSSSHS